MFEMFKEEKGNYLIRKGGHGLSVSAIKEVNIKPSPAHCAQSEIHNFEFQACKRH